MKKYIIPILLAAIIFIAAPQPAQAVYALSAKTLTRIGFRTQQITQTTTDLTTINDVFAAEPISGNFVWTAYIKNTGAAALTDLNVLVHYENANWDDAPINIVDATPISGMWNASCTTTLAADTVCLVGISASSALGYMKITASAGSSTSVAVIFIKRVI